MVEHYASVYNLLRAIQLSCLDSDEAIQKQTNTIEAPTIQSIVNDRNLLMMVSSPHFIKTFTNQNMLAQCNNPNLYLHLMFHNLQLPIEYRSRLGSMLLTQAMISRLKVDFSYEALVEHLQTLPVEHANFAALVFGNPQLFQISQDPVVLRLVADGPMMQLICNPRFARIFDDPLFWNSIPPPRVLSPQYPTNPRTVEEISSMRIAMNIVAETVSAVSRQASNKGFSVLIDMSALLRSMRIDVNPPRPANLPPVPIYPNMPNVWTNSMEPMPQIIGTTSRGQFKVPQFRPPAPPNSHPANYRTTNFRRVKVPVSTTISSFPLNNQAPVQIRPVDATNGETVTVNVNPASAGMVNMNMNTNMNMNMPSLLGPVATTANPSPFDAAAPINFSTIPFMPFDVPQGVVQSGAQAQGNIPPFNINLVNAGSNLTPIEAVPVVSSANVPETNIAPEAVVPVNVAPINVQPVDAAPITIVPEEVAPVSDTPGGEAPVSDTSEESAPVNVAPGDVAPVNLKQGDMAPVSNTHGEDAPVNNVAKNMAPVNVAPGNVASINDTSKEDSPINNAAEDVTSVNVAPVNVAQGEIAPVNNTAKNVAPVNVAQRDMAPDSTTGDNSPLDAQSTDDASANIPPTNIAPGDGPPHAKKVRKEMENSK